MTLTELEPPNVYATPEVQQVGRRRARREAERDAGVRTDRRERAPLSPIRGTVVWVLATIALLAIWFVFYALILTPFQEQHAQADLYSTMRTELAQQVAPLGGVLDSGAPVAIMSAPALGLNDTVIVEGTAAGDTTNGPGHRRDTVLPGQAGVSVIYGRASLFGGPFGAIRNASVGEAITVTTGQGVFTYKVTGVRRVGDPYPQPLNTGEGRLTLVTADGSGRVAALLNPSGVLYVDAMLVGKSQPSPGVGVAQVPDAETAMQGDISSLLLLMMVLPILLSSIIFVVWARSRWGAWQTWLVGVPLVCAALWAVSQATIQLLPNLL